MRRLTTKPYANNPRDAVHRMMILSALQRLNDHLYFGIISTELKREKSVLHAVDESITELNKLKISLNKKDHNKEFYRLNKSGM